MILDKWRILVNRPGSSQEGEKSGFRTDHKASAKGKDGRGPGRSQRRGKTTFELDHRKGNVEAASLNRAPKGGCWCPEDALRGCKRRKGGW